MQCARININTVLHGSGKKTNVIDEPLVQCMEDIPKQDIWDEKISLAIPNFVVSLVQIMTFRVHPALLKYVYCMIDYSSSTLQKKSR